MLAASVESQSEHPIAAAILASALARRGGFDCRALRMSARCPASASKDSVEGRLRRVWHAAPVQRARRDRAGHRLRWRTMSSTRGMSPIVVARNGTVKIGVLGVTDRPKTEAAQVDASTSAPRV